MNRATCYFYTHNVVAMCVLLFSALAVPTLHARSVAMTLMATLVGNSLYIEGSTDLPDKTIIEWEVFDEKSLNGSPGPDVWAEEGRTVVTHGKYSAVVHLNKWPCANLTVWSAFQPVAFGTPQPKLIDELFGECGELLEGKNVSVVGSFRNMRRVALARRVWWNPTR
jgi:hypothetical protein